MNIMTFPHPSDPGVRKRVIDTCITYLRQHPHASQGELLKWLNNNRLPPLTEAVRVARQAAAVESANNLLRGAGNVVRPDGSLRNPVIKDEVKTALSTVTPVTVVPPPKPVPIEVKITPAPPADQPQTERKFIISGTAERTKYAEDLALENPARGHSWLYTKVKERFGVGLSPERLDEILVTARELLGLDTNQFGSKAGVPRKADGSTDREQGKEQTVGHPLMQKGVPQAPEWKQKAWATRKAKMAEKAKALDEPKFVKDLPSRKQPKRERALGKVEQWAAEVMAKLMNNPGQWALVVSSTKNGGVAHYHFTLKKLGAEVAIRGMSLYARVKE